jgi:hypothetical protein
MQRTELLDDRLESAALPQQLMHLNEGVEPGPLAMEDVCRNNGLRQRPPES